MNAYPPGSENLTYAELEARILAWATDRLDLRLAILVGSRARLPVTAAPHPEQSCPRRASRGAAQSKGAHLPPADEWSDLDLVFFTTALQDYTASSAWLEQFGDLWASWLDNTGQGYPEWFALYAGGLKLDIALVPLAADSPASLPELLAGFAHPDVLARGLRLLLDRTSFQGEIPLPHPAQNSSLPSHEEFQRAQGRFWITAAKAAKLIRRGDVWRAKQAVDGELKECLLNMLEWHACCVYRPGQDTWYDGRALDRWADPRALDALPAVFAVYDSTDMKRALLESMTLFRWLTAELAAALGFPISDDARLYAWLTCRFA